MSRKAADYYADSIPEDGDLPTGIEEAFSVLSDAILCWVPSSTAVTVSA